MNETPIHFRFSIRALLLCTTLVALALMPLIYPNELTIWIMDLASGVLTATAIVVAIRSAGDRQLYWTTFAVFFVTFLIVLRNSFPYEWSEPLWTAIHDSDGLQLHNHSIFLGFSTAVDRIVALLVSVIAGFVAAFITARSSRNPGA